MLTLSQFDEVIPDELDTQFGGFYINFGDLMFKKVEPVIRYLSVVAPRPKGSQLKCLGARLTLAEFFDYRGHFTHKRNFSAGAVTICR